MHEFFLSISSDAGRSEVQNGGHFIVDLHNEIRMPRGEWEMALMEMSYYNQAFPNIPNTSGYVTVSCPITPFTNFNYVVTYPAIEKFWFRLEKGGEGHWNTLERYTFPLRHHSVTDLQRYFDNVKHHYGGGNILEMKLELQQLKIKSKMPSFNIRYANRRVHFSKRFCEVLKIANPNVYFYDEGSILEVANRVVPVTLVNEHDITPPLIKPFHGRDDLWVEVDGRRMMIPVMS